MAKNIYKRNKTGAIIFCVTLLCFVLAATPIFSSILKQQKIDNEMKQLSSIEEIKDEQGLQSLAEINSDFAGWIIINDVNISLPVVFSNNQSDDFYLSHDFKKQPSILGIPYLTKNSTLYTDNVVIVGHSAYYSSNNKTNVIFGNLKNYLSPQDSFDYRIKLQTLQGNFDYTIISVFSFTTTDYSKAAKIFNTNTLQTTNQLEEFKLLISQLSNKSIDNINVGDKFLTLYTCDKDKSIRKQAIQYVNEIHLEAKEMAENEINSILEFKKTTDELR